MDVVRRGWLVGLVCVTGFGMFADEPAAGSLSLQAGIGYEFLSQRFFADSTLNQGSDSTLAAWKLTSTYLDDINGRFTVRWRPLASAERLELGATVEQTPDFLRLKTTGSLRYRRGRTSLDTDSELEWRDRLGAAAVFGDSYLSTYSRVKMSLSLNRVVKALGRLNLETVDFHSAGTFALDYIRAGGTIGLEKTFGDFSWAELDLLYSQRTTADSAALDYAAAGAELSFLGFLPNGSLDLRARLESRNFRQTDSPDDHWRAEVFGRNRLGLSERWFGLQEIDLEQVWYAGEDWVTADYLRLGGNAQFGVEAGSVTVSAGPDLEFLTRTGKIIDSLKFDGEDYWEAGGKIDIDFLGDNGLLLSTESTTGYRTLRYENELQTSFWYERVFLLADIRILKVLNFSTLFSGEWEWHQDRSSNSQLYLLSTNLTYSF